MLTLLLTAGAEFVAFVLRLSAKKLYATLALALSALPPLSQVFVELHKDLRGSGGLTDSGAELLALELGIVALAALSLGRFSRVFFWLGWTLNLALTGAFAYVLFEWRPFS